MINTQATGSNPLSAIEITPLIDIVFIVIVFLLVTANTPLLSLPVNVPAADKQSVLTASDVDTVAYVYHGKYKPNAKNFQKPLLEV